MPKKVDRKIQIIQPIPENPGIYQFRDKTGKILYVGKAKNLRNRINSYFSNQLLPKTAQMVVLATNLTYIKVTSEFEALLLEANLIKKYKPKYNIELKDDKSPLYIGITKDKYPRIITFRKPEIPNLLLNDYFGPYITGMSARTVLKKIRKIFPFSTHSPIKQGSLHRLCIYKQIGLCDPCPSEIENTQDPLLKKKLINRYRRNVHGVRRILKGKLREVEKELEKEIKEYSSRERFEEAQEIAIQLNAFRNIALKEERNVEDYLQNPNLAEDSRVAEVKDLTQVLSKYFNNLSKLKRIECYDIAHLSGSFPTASMVTFINGEADKKYYRHFKIYGSKRISDVDSMREVVTRRLKHLDDWGRADLIVIDGGKPQLTAVYDLLGNEKIPFIGLAKRLETIVIREGQGKFIELRASGPSLRLLQRMRDEAHRFARRLHHKQMGKSLLS